jgi:hypothetical protein
MPAGNSVAAANHIYNVAPKDGTAIALLQRGMLLAHLISPGSIQFDVTKLNWLASLNSETGLVLVLSNSQHQTTKDLFEKELIVGATLDPQLGHVLMCGLGGIYVEEIRDVAFKLAPVSLEDAHELMASLRGYAILKGVRGEQAVDFDFAADLICRTSALVTNHPDIAEIEFNPVIVSSPGRSSCVVDARVRVTPTLSGPSAS